MVPSVVSHYKILEKLGEGGMGVVYKAHDTKLDRLVALKFLPYHLSSSETEQSRFLQEARAAAALNHPHVCSVIDIQEADGQQFIVMEFVDGVTLRQRSPVANVDEAIEYAIQIGEALQEAHSKGIVHRDIKSENIMVNTRNHIKVMDFGLAKLKGSLKLTNASSTVGTLAYMAPEQIEGREADGRSDIFSFGVVLFEMLTGKMPFHGEHHAAVMYSIVNEEPDPLVKYLPATGPDLQRIISRALEKDPGNRYQHVDEMVKELRLLRIPSPRVERPGSPGMQPASSSKYLFSPGRKLMVGVVVLAVLASIAILILLNLPAKKSESPSTRKMLVVLPFENLGASDKDYFADGLTGEITSKLSGISGLSVIARSSAMQYKKTSKTLKQIREELGVDYVLEGTLQWEENAQGVKRVRVNPELIEIANATQIWSQPYEADVSGAFKLQADIATTVAAALNITLMASEKQSLRGALTDNSEAYDTYLSALPYATDIENEKRIRIAEQSFRKAVELDGKFAAAYAGLSQMQSFLYWEYFEHNVETLDKSRENAQKALTLDPRLPAAHVAMGDHYYRCRLNYDAAVGEYREALRLQPNSVEANSGIGFVLRRQGDMRNAVEYLRKALDFDPRNYTTAFSVGETYVLLRDYGKAGPFLDRAITLAPDAISPYDFQARIHMLSDGNTAKARAVVENAMKRKIGEGDSHFRYTLFRCDCLEGNLASALKRVAGIDKLDDQFMFKPEDLLVAQVHGLMKNASKAREKYVSARQILAARINEYPEDSRLHSSLGLAYAGLGQKTDAVREGKRGVELLPISKEAWRGTFRMLDLAQIYAMVGEQDLALEALEELLARPTDAITGALLKIDPTWQPLRENPRFQKLLSKFPEGEPE